MEVGWYLRFAKVDLVEVIAKEDRLNQVKGVLYTEPGWEFESRAHGPGLVLARFSRKQRSS